MSESQTIESTHEVQTATSAGRPVADRITTIEAARAIYAKLREKSFEDAERRLRIKGQIDGRPPYNPAKLKELGLGYLTNVNFLELRAMLDDRAARRFSSYFEVPELIQAKQVANVDPASDAPNYGMVVAEEFTKLLKEDWEGFAPLMDLVGREADEYGFGVAMFPDEWDWRPEERHVSNFFPDPNAKVDLTKMSMFCYNGTFKPTELFERISDPALAAQAGWNVPAVRKLLVRLFVKKENAHDPFGQQHGNPWEEIEQRFRNNDTTVQIEELRDIEVVHLVYAQVDDGEVGHKIFSRAEGEKDEFLFEAPRRYKSMRNALWCLPFNYGDGYLRSCRGIASYIEQHCDLSNRYLGSAFDAGRTASTLLVQPTNPAGYDRLQIVRQGILTVVDHRLTIQQSSFQPRINDLIALRRVSSELMQNNTRELKYMPEDPSFNPQPKTAEEVRELSSRFARGEQSQTVFYAAQLQKLYREIFRRLTNPEYLLSNVDRPGLGLALGFAIRCVERGVPLELLLDYDQWRILAVKPIGGGSPQARNSALMDMMQLRGEADEKGRREILRDYAASRVGYDYVDRYFPPKTRDSISTNEHSIASLETSDFYSGAQGVVGSDQNHVIHFTVHAQPVQQVAQAIEEQGIEAIDPQRAIPLLSAALPHMEQHLQYLQREPTRKDFVRQGVEVLKGGVKALDECKRAVEKMQEAQAKLEQEQAEKLGQAEQRAFTAEQQLELAKAQMKQEVEVQKQASLNAMRAMKTQDQMRINADRAASDIRLKSERQAAELELMRRKTEAEVEAKRAKTKSPGE